MYKKIIFFSLGFLIIFIGFKITEANTTKSITVLNYENKNLGISFDYPSNFEVYQQDKNSLRIESDYQKKGKPYFSVGMNIKRVNSQRENLEKVKKIWALSGEKISKVLKLDNYDLVIGSEGTNYILSDNGTFFVGDSVDVHKKLLKQEGLYQSYKSKFLEIKNSIKIISLKKP